MRLKGLPQIYYIFKSSGLQLNFRNERASSNIYPQLSRLIIIDVFCLV